MIFHRYILILLVLTSFSACLDTPESVYYIDSKTGNDANTGKSPQRAWASLEKVNAQTFQPGDKILFRSDTQYSGQLKPSGSGEKGKPIVINNYDEGSRPRLDGEGNYQATVHLYNVEYWEVRNLEITNTGREREAGRRGVIIEAYNYGDAHHLYLDSLTIHSVNGSLVKSEGGGSAILWKNGGDEVKTRFVDLRIENSHLYKTARNGINSRGYSNRDNWHPSLEVVVRNNLLEQIPGDGIVPIGTDGALIEHNVLRDFSAILPDGEAAAGIWPWSSDNTIIQYNEVSGHNAPWDAQGFDADWNSRNTIIQYNYSHDNAGGFLLICNNGNNIGTPGNIGTSGTIVRFNVSVNDGIRKFETPRKGMFSPTFHISGPVENTKIYNNVIYVPTKPNGMVDRTILQMDNWGGPWPENTLFANNIIVAEEPSGFNWGESTDNNFSNNLYYGEFENMPVDSEAIYEDPMFLNPFMATRGLESLSGFRLMPGSPAINAGVNIFDNPLDDLFGTIIRPSDPVSIGIHQFDD